MAMETKDLIGLILIPLAIVGATVLLSAFPKLRPAAFFFMVAAFVISDRLDINFVSRQWYRGTTRGIEFSFVDILALGLVLSWLIAPRPGQKRFFWPASLGLMLAYVPITPSLTAWYGSGSLFVVMLHLTLCVVAASAALGRRALPGGEDGRAP